MPETNAWGMTSKGTSLAVVGYNRDKVMEFFTVNGVPSVSSLGGHNYVRVA